MAEHVAADVSSTQPVTRSTGQPGSDPTRSTVNRINPTRSTGQPGHRSTRPGQWPTRPGKPGQRSTGSNRSTRPGHHSPAALPRAATCFHTHRLFWWRVRAREREFLGNFGTYRFVSKFPTMWYIDLACLKLLKT